MPKFVDELRVLSNKKQYKGLRVISGIKENKVKLSLQKLLKIDLIDIIIILKIDILLQL